MLSRALRRALGKVERRSVGIPVNDPAVALILGGYRPTAAGVTVTPETALDCSAVFGAVRILAESLAQLPVHMYRRLPDGGRERADDHPVYPLIAEAPNAWMTASEFRLVTASHFALHGNAYAWVGRDRGVPVEMIPLQPRGIAIKVNPVTMQPMFVIPANGGTREYDRSEILHIRGIGRHLYQGDSPVEAAREAIALLLVLEKHGAGLFGRGARPSGLLKAAKKLGEDTFKRLRASFESLYAGGENAGRTAILEEGMDFVQLQLSSVDAQFMELRKFQIQEIARVWRIPLHLLGDMERTTHNNAESMGQQFVSFTLLPILRLYREALQLTLLTPAERREYLIDFVVDDLVRADIAARFTAYSQAINAGILCPNEPREMENRPPYRGGEVFMRPVNTAPAPTDSTAPKGQEGTINDAAA
jgi:HK97 family phage portal protein